VRENKIQNTTYRFLDLVIPKLSDSEHDNVDSFNDLILPIWFTAFILYSLHKQECLCYIIAQFRL